MELFEQAGADVWADRARADIAALGLKRGPAKELTPMEDRIARAVAAGATNRQAASALFLSQRTIEFHLRNVYRKLHLHSRGELAVDLAGAADTSSTTGDLEAGLRYSFGMETFVKSYWSSRFGSQLWIPYLRRVVNVNQYRGPHQQPSARPGQLCLRLRIELVPLCVVGRRPGPLDEGVVRGVA